MEEKEIVVRTSKNREITELTLMQAVGDLIEEEGFENLGVNAVAAKAGVSKMLIYRYFDSLDGLIVAYINKHDYWINLEVEMPALEYLGDFVKTLFRNQIKSLRDNYTLRRLYRWELSTQNKVTKDLRDRREAKGIWIVEAVCKITGRPKEEVSVMATLLTSSLTYLVLLEENCPVFNGIQLQTETGWEQLENGIDKIIDGWINKYENE